MANQLTWYGCEWPSGRIIAELPGLQAQGPLQHRLGGVTTTQFNLDLSANSPSWIAATQHGRALLVAVLDNTPLWAGAALTRDRGSAPFSALSATTVEGYLGRRFTPDLTYAATDRSSIAAGLLAVIQPSVPCLDITTTPTGVFSDRTYADADDKSLLSNLQELMAIQRGPEWTVDPVWAPDGSGFRLNARVAPRIGSQNPGVTAVFDYPGPVTTYRQLESYVDGKGATAVRANGAGEGDARARSDTLTSTLVAAGWPIYEYRWSPGSDITSLDVLTGHAQAALALMESGASAWSMTAAATEAPTLGTDWGLGDQVRLLVQPGTSPGHPDGADVIARCWAWELDTIAWTVAPILVEET
ncbi:hypothetical protein ACIQC7_28000 [Kitasatospora sp. NPDC088556]|uniref:hypothetical protein n=1 Tax=Kitasatospora sp. NPDC088556 TaxID=3364076 RepID=UPI003809D6E5